MEDQNYPKPGSTVSGVQDTDDSVVAPPPVVSLRDYLDTKIGALAQRVEDLGQHLNARMGDLAQQLNARMDDLEAKVDTRVDSLEVKVDARMDSLEARMDRTEKLLLTIWIFSMGIVGAGFVYLTSRMDRMTERMNEIMIILERLP